ncbi:hypothetical protein F4778DRAFT_328173 [Xylariomycetidae sp. FL2044]|nr:hypothetical protein F4778DRAFT_328173 [Xylariomycetidae sp. FL2044]
MSRPLRASCDRCHSQKLRCSKGSGVATCLRCQKAGTDCVFSPPAARFAARRNLSAATLQNDAHFVDTSLSLDPVLGLNFEWPPPGLDHAAIFTPPPADIQPDPASHTGPSPRAACVRQLTNLACDLDHANQSVPSILSAIHKLLTSQDRAIAELEVNESAANGNVHPLRFLEHIFNLGQRLIDLYPQVLRLMFASSTDAECRDGHSGATADAVASYMTAMGEPRSVDTFLFNILIACHSGVSRFMGAVLPGGNLCARMAQGSTETGEHEMHIAEVRVGSFVASASSSSSMQAVLLVHIATVLAERAHQLREGVAEATKDDKNDCDGNREVLMTQCNLLEEGAQSFLTQLKQMRELLIKMGILH